MDDLQRVLGYLDAVDPSSLDASPVEIGRDLLTVPWWTPTFCHALIRAAEAVGGFQSDPDDPVPGEEISLAAISPRLFEAVQDDVGTRLWPALRRHWPLIDYHGLRDAFVIRYEPGRQTALRLHHDVAQVSASVKLNDGYEGGVLEFPQQQTSNQSLGVGSLLAWPSLVTHPHRATAVTSGVKYSLTIWCELPEQYH
jgi:hypothetical protein